MTNIFADIDDIMKDIQDDVKKNDPEILGIA